MASQSLCILDDADDLENYAEQALKNLSLIFEVEQGKIRPDDRFDSEFSPVRGSELDSPLTTLRLEVAHDAQKHGIKLEEIEIDTAFSDLQLPFVHLPKLAEGKQQLRTDWPTLPIEAAHGASGARFAWWTAVQSVASFLSSANQGTIVAPLAADYGFYRNRPHIPHKHAFVTSFCTKNKQGGLSAGNERRYNRRFCPKYHFQRT